ncbi:MAG: hypothetical protein NTV32_05670 [Gammaproteobacteria bacterium]|nr:hypothetical protein [Gammaproteobacteria bacterium]
MKWTGNQDLIIASKTILTVALSFLACAWFLQSAIALYFVLYTATCCALMQSGSNQREHLSSMLLAGCAFILFLTLGLLLKDTVWLKNISLIAFAFLAFYLPNLGLNYKMPPVFGVIFYVCVLEMTPPTDPTGLIILANVFAVGIAILVYFLFWPYRPEHELTLLSCHFLKQYRKAILSFRQALFATDAKRRQAHLHKILEPAKNLEATLNQFNTLTGQRALDKKDALYFGELYVHFYGTFQMIQMMRNTMGNFPKNPISSQLLKDLERTLREIETQLNARLPHSVLSTLLSQPTLQTPQKILTVIEFDTLLDQLVDEQMADGPEGQFAYALVRLKENYTQMKEQLDHWQLKRVRGFFL